MRRVVRELSSQPAAMAPSVAWSPASSIRLPRLGWCRSAAATTSPRICTFPWISLARLK